MNKSDCAKIIAILATNDRTGVVTPATIDAWELVMQDIPYEAAQVAAYQWLMHSKWFPMPAEFRDILVNALTGLPDPDDAWSVVIARMKATYPGQDAPAWDAPEAIRLAVQTMGGMSTLRTSSNAGKDAERFATVYRRYRDRELQNFDIGAEWKRQIAAGVSPFQLPSNPGIRAVS
jgi:hypothetical protein